MTVIFIGYRASVARMATAREYHHDVVENTTHSQAVSPIGRRGASG
jgi:hypothetical protein